MWTPMYAPILLGTLKLLLRVQRRCSAWAAVPRETRRPSMVSGCITWAEGCQDFWLSAPEGVRSAC